MPTYRQHRDTRDGTIYNCVLMPDGKWWSAENLRWAGAGVPPDNNPANIATLGRLYYRDDIPGAVPPGAHAPIRSEMTQMLNSLGLGTVADGGAIPSAVSYALLSALAGGSDAYGFAALKAGRIYLGSPSEFGYAAWIGIYSIDSQYYFAQMYNGGGAYTQAGPTQNAFSVRFIVDVFNEPIPHPSDFFPPPGTYENPQVVSLNKTGMLYTLDGTDPTPNSPTFDTPIRISGPTEIRLKSPHMPDVFSFSYLVKGRPLPTYKQAALWADGTASPETITRTYNG